MSPEPLTLRRFLALAILCMSAVTLTGCSAGHRFARHQPADDYVMAVAGESKEGNARMEQPATLERSAPQPNDSGFWSRLSSPLRVQLPLTDAPDDEIAATNDSGFDSGF